MFDFVIFGVLLHLRELVTYRFIFQLGLTDHFVECVRIGVSCCLLLMLLIILLLCGCVCRACVFLVANWWVCVLCIQVTIGGFPVSRRLARFMVPMCVCSHLSSFLHFFMFFFFRDFVSACFFFVFVISDFVFFFCRDFCPDFCFHVLGFVILFL